MTKKNIFAYKLILPLNISEFNLFFMWKSPPTSWKKSPLPHPLLNLWLEVQPPPSRKGAAQYVYYLLYFYANCILSLFPYYHYLQNKLMKLPDFLQLIQIHEKKLIEKFLSGHEKMVVTTLFTLPAFISRMNRWNKRFFCMLTQIQENWKLRQWFFGEHR